MIIAGSISIDIVLTRGEEVSESTKPLSSIKARQAFVITQWRISSPT